MAQVSSSARILSAFRSTFILDLKASAGNAQRRHEAMTIREHEGRRNDSIVLGKWNLNGKWRSRFEIGESEKRRRVRAVESSGANFEAWRGNERDDSQ